jgi:hypothetical protein
MEEEEAITVLFLSAGEGNLVSLALMDGMDYV